MLNSRTKDKIYAFLSFLAIVLAIGSFVLVVNFLLQINKYIFNLDEKIVKEKTTVMDKAGFENIREKLRLKESGGAEEPPAEIVPLETSSVNETAMPSPSPSLSPSPSPSPSPSSSPSPSPRPSSSPSPSPSPRPSNSPLP